MSGKSIKDSKKSKHGCLVVALGVFAMLAAAGLVFSRFGGFGTGPSADADEFKKYATSVADIQLPEGTRVVALGEATHGNREFQQLKLSVFQVLVEQYDVQAFALEGDFGGCEAVNRYIHGGDGTAEEAAAAIGFTIYRTSEMAELISWMRTYNETAAPGNDLRFYGFDMQRYERSYLYLCEELTKLGLDSSALDSLWNDGEYAEGVGPEKLEEVLSELREQIAELGKEEDTTLALHLLDMLIQNAELGKVADSPEAYGLRDSYMAQNVLWILAQEEVRGNSCIFISGHNGHIEQSGSYGSEALVMGNLLASELGEECYCAIGTDFFKATVNLPKGDSRMTHSFYSYDPLAKAAATCGYDSCWLNFAGVPQDSSLRAFIDGPIMMGSVGEGFSPLMYLLPQAYRVKREPSSPYDSMIFVPYATPTDPDMSGK